MAEAKVQTSGRTPAGMSAGWCIPLSVVAAQAFLAQAALAQGEQPAISELPAASEQAPGVPGTTADGGIGQGPPAPGPGTQTSPGLLGNPLTLVFGMVLIFMLMTVFTGRKDKKRRAEMLSALKRHDRVQTLGGIIGTVVELKDDEVVLRVDEGTNTRIRFARSAVQQVLRESSAKDGAAQVESKPAEKAAV